MEQDQFTVLENKTIGRNISMFRKVRERKAAEVAEGIGISETAYTKYERGETQITIEFLQKVARELKVDPLTLISSSPNNVVENSNNFAIHGTVQTTDEKQTQLLITLVQNVMAMNEKIMAYLEKK